MQIKGSALAIFSIIVYLNFDGKPGPIITSTGLWGWERVNNGQWLRHFHILGDAYEVKFIDTG